MSTLRLSSAYILFDIGHPCYGQLTVVKKVFADQYHMTISRAYVFFYFDR